MSVNNRNYIIIVILLFVCSIFIFRIEGRNTFDKTEINLNQLPEYLNGWKARDIEVSDRVYEVLETKNVLVRQYKDLQGDSVVLTVVHSGSNRNSFHPPEYCYIGGGAEILEKGKEKIIIDEENNLATNKLVMKDSKGQKISAWYWFSAQGEFISSYYLQQLNFLWNALKGKEFQGALIRVSVRGGRSNSEAKAKSFIRDIIPHLKKIL